MFSYLKENRIFIFIFIENIFILSPFICMSLFIFNIEDSKSWMSRLIVAVGLYCIFRFKGEISRKLNNKSFKIFLYGSIPSFLYFGFLHLFFDESVSFSRTLLSSLFYLLVIPTDKISIRRILFIFSIGGLASGFNSFHEVFILDQARAGNIAVNSIPYSIYCSFLMLLCLSGALFFGKNQKRYFTLLYSVGALGACTGLILSQTRGVWLASLVPLLMFFLILFKRNLKLISLKNVIVITLTVISIGVVFKDTFLHRYEQTVNEVKLISDSENTMVDSSIGIRLQLWSIGLSHISDNLIFGIGSEKDNTLTDIDYEEGRITVLAYNYHGAHYHNQYIDSFVKFGFLGFLFIICYILSPLIASWISKDRYKFICISSMTTIIIISGITDVPFHHTHIVYLYSLISGGVILSLNKEK